MRFFTCFFTGLNYLRNYSTTIFPSTNKHLLCVRSRNKEKLQLSNKTFHPCWKISICAVCIWKQLKTFANFLLISLKLPRNSVKLLLIIMRKVLNDRRIAFNFETSSRSFRESRDFFCFFSL